MVVIVVWILAGIFGQIFTVTGGNSTVYHDLDRDGYGTESVSAEKTVIQTLLNTYSRVGRMGRPLRDSSQNVTVSFGLGLIQMDLNENSKVLTMSMWTKYMWHDEYLVWNPLDHGRVQSVRLEPDQIWKPDIMLYNTAEIDQTARDALVVVTADGNVFWYPHTIFYSTCAIDVSNFPFDSQQCHMWFGSWTHPSNELDIQIAHPNGIDLSTFQADHKESCGWDIVNVSAVRQIMPSEEEHPNFVVIQIDLNMKRKVVFSSYMLTLPCVFLACLSLVVFWLPPERPDRTALAMSTFGSFMVLLLILVEAAPPTASSIPTLGLYYSFNMVLIMLAIVLSSLVVNTSRGSPKEIPRWLTKITNSFLVRALCLRPMPLIPEKTLKAHSARKNGGKSLTSKSVNAYCPVGNGNTTNSESYLCINGRTGSFLANSPSSHNRGIKDEEDNISIRNTMRDIHQTVQRIDDVIENAGAERLGSGVNSGALCNYEEWAHVSKVLDRFFFLVYVILIIVSLLVLFPRPVIN